MIAVAVLAEVFADYGADAGVVVAYDDGGVDGGGEHGESASGGILHGGRRGGARRAARLLGRAGAGRSIRPRWFRCAAETMVRQMARPRPVPPFWRESEASTCWKRSKMESSLSTGMPRPWSETRSRMASTEASMRTSTSDCGRREFDGVREQVGEDLEDAVGVAVEEDGLGRPSAMRTSSSLTWAASAMGVMVSMDCWARFAQGAAVDVHGGAAGLHALEIEDVVDEADEAVGVGDGDAQEVWRLWRRRRP